MKASGDHKAEKSVVFCAVVRVYVGGGPAPVMETTLHPSALPIGEGIGKKRFPLRCRP